MASADAGPARCPALRAEGHLRRHGRCGHEAAGAGHREAEGSEGFQLHRQAEKRLDAQLKSTGKQVFGMDLAPPGKLAVVARPPVFGAKRLVSMVAGERDQGRDRSAGGADAAAAAWSWSPTATGPPRRAATRWSSTGIARRRKIAATSSWPSTRLARPGLPVHKADIAAGRRRRRSRRRIPVPGARADGAAELPRSTSPRRLHRVGRLTVPDVDQGAIAARRPEAGAGGAEHDDGRRRFRPPRPCRPTTWSKRSTSPRYRPPAEGPGQGDLEPRGRHQGRLLSSVARAPRRIGIDDKGNIVAWDHVIVGQSIITGTPFERFMIKNGIDATMVEGMGETL